MDRKVWTETLIEVGSQLCLGSVRLGCCLGLPPLFPHLTDPSALELERPSGSSSGWGLEQIDFWQS